MTTHVYEPTHPKPGETSRHFEMKQATNGGPLTKHPDTGEPIRRVVLGGYGVLSSSPKNSSTQADAGGGCCGGTGCCG